MSYPKNWPLKFQIEDKVHRIRSKVTDLLTAFHDAGMNDWCGPAEDAYFAAEKALYQTIEDVLLGKPFEPTKDSPIYDEWLNAQLTDMEKASTNLEDKVVVDLDTLTARIKAVDFLEEVRKVHESK